MNNALQQPSLSETFDYSCIADKNARFAAVDAAANVRNGLSNQAEIIIEIGTILIDAKEHLLPHGSFNNWLRLELAMSPRTAQQYMMVARNFGSKPATVAHLKPTTLYELSSARNERARLEVVERLQAGEPLDDARVREITKAMRPEITSHSEMQKPACTAPFNIDPAGPSDTMVHFIDHQHVGAYSELTAFLAPRCYGEFERLISLLGRAGCNDVALYMQWHRDAVMKDPTQLLLVSNSNEEPGLFHLTESDGGVGGDGANIRSSRQLPGESEASLRAEAGDLLVRQGRLRNSRL